MSSTHPVSSLGTGVAWQPVATSGQARAGVLHTRHGLVRTPAFMPVATRATVKSLTPSEVESTGADLVIMNTYHLWLRPGEDIVQAHGGLHHFAQWPRPIVTDSGGYQAFSLAARTRVTEDGFAFSSHLDGTHCLLSPEESMRVQAALGSDIAMQLDVCPRADATPAEWVEAVERTTRWAVRCLAARSPTQAMFGIVQGGTDIPLRRRHLETLCELDLDGVALGGFSVGEPPQHMHDAVSAVAPMMPAHKPRYLMGVGTPEDLVIAVAAGVDLFDCVLPTRNARNGQAFVSTGRLAIKQARYRHDLGPLESGCACATCQGGFTRAYLRHLYMAGEILSHRLLTLHNLQFYGQLLARARQAILEDKYARWAEKTLRSLGVR